MALAQSISMLAGLITVMALTRGLGPEIFGVIGFAVAVASYLGLWTNFGMDSHGVREIARDKSQAPRIAGITLTARLAMAIFAGLALLAGIGLTQPDDTMRAVLMIQAAGLIFVATNVEFVYQGLQRMTAIAWRQITAAITVAGATFVFVSEPAHVFIAAAIPITVNLLTAIVLLIHFRLRVAPIALAIPLAEHRDFIRRSAPVALMGILVTIQLNIDIIMLGVLRSEFEVGLYAAASRLFTVAVVLATLLHGIYLPVFSESGPGTEAPPRSTAIYAQILGIFGGTMVIIGALLSGPVIDLLFGVKFTTAETALVILLLSAGLFYFAQAYGTPLLAWQSDRAYLKIVALTAILNLMLNAVLIPNFGMEGAAAATLATYAVFLLVLGVVVGKAYKLNHSRLFGKIIALAVVCALPMTLLRYIGKSVSVSEIIFGGIASLVVFVWMCNRLGVFKPSELRRFFTS